MSKVRNTEKRTGRRRAVDIDSPRDKTVCFMVSEIEKESIDDLCIALGKTRSSILTKIVVLFLEGVTKTDESERVIGEMKEFLSECQDAFAENDNQRSAI